MYLRLLYSSFFQTSHFTPINYFIKLQNIQSHVGILSDEKKERKKSLGTKNTCKSSKSVNIVTLIEYRRLLLTKSILFSNKICNICFLIFEFFLPFLYFQTYLKETKTLITKNWNKIEQKQKKVRERKLNHFLKLFHFGQKKKSLFFTQKQTLKTENSCEPLLKIRSSNFNMAGYKFMTVIYKKNT